MILGSIPNGAGPYSGDVVAFALLRVLTFHRRIDAQARLRPGPKKKRKKEEKK